MKKSTFDDLTMNLPFMTNHQLKELTKLLMRELYSRDIKQLTIEDDKTTWLCACTDEGIPCPICE